MNGNRAKSVGKNGECYHGKTSVREMIMEQHEGFDMSRTMLDLDELDALQADMRAAAVLADRLLAERRQNRQEGPSARPGSTIGVDPMQA